MNKYDVIVIGGGPAGMIAAGTAGKFKKSVILLERNNVLGVKLRITGNGRCNFTNKMPLNRFQDYYVDNPKFLHNAFNKFFNHDLIKFFELLGVRTKVENNGRVFPLSDQSADIIQALELYLQNNKVQVACRSLVTDIIVENNQVAGVKLSGEETVKAGKVIIATGGKSYPNLGSNGSAYSWALKTGHNIILPRPGLSGIQIKELWVKGLQGISLNQIGISLYVNAKKKKQISADLVFAHYGISGPGAFDLSADVGDCLVKGSVVLCLDLFPEINESQVMEKLDDIIAKSPGCMCKNLAFNEVPKKLIAVCHDLAGINASKPLSQLSKKEKRSLINIFKQVQLTVQSLRPLKEAMVTRGGISVKQINPATMESRIVSGLYFCGELIDISGLSGGFNLQAAFSTGYLAGLGAAVEPKIEDRKPMDEGRSLR
ncbi:MAG: NAD(P)/FAD-dependent oxidoreductase [Candidatus Omnitrophica bacterium]|nr:NAD(P)/FAD-dependent oxidoreductase [Candidatus Omnitrophota bacterium]